MSSSTVMLREWGEGRSVCRRNANLSEGKAGRPPAAVGHFNSSPEMGTFFSFSSSNANSFRFWRRSIRSGVCRHAAEEYAMTRALPYMAMAMSFGVIMCQGGAGRKK
eukprot:EG_transcript_63772